MRGRTRLFRLRTPRRCCFLSRTSRFALLLRRYVLVSAPPPPSSPLPRFSPSPSPLTSLLPKKDRANSTSPPARLVHRPPRDRPLPFLPSPPLPHGLWKGRDPDCAPLGFGRVRGGQGDGQGEGRGGDVGVCEGVGEYRLDKNREGLYDLCCECSVG